jgi:two-component system, NarL family, sensor kinase
VANQSVMSDTEKLRSRDRELTILYAIARALNHEVDLTQSLRTALAHVVQLFDLQTGWVWLINEETGTPYLAAVQNLPPALENAPHLMDGSKYCLCLDTYESGDMDGAANVNILTCTRLKGLVDGTDGLRNHASIPLYAHGKNLGILNVASQDWRELSPDDLRLLSTVGDLLSIAIERARLFERSAEYGVMEERNRLAREIHDTLAQGLAAIALQLETADALLESGASLDQARQAAQQALKLTRHNLDEARRSVLDLRAAPLEGRVLTDALGELAQEYAARGGLELNFSGGEERSLPVRIEAGLYRIAQEALTNVLNHAQAKTLTIQLTTLPHRVELVIEDDGRGFDPSQVMKGRYGLIGLNERVRLLGGHLEICSERGEGTRLDITIPLKVDQ